MMRQMRMKAAKYAGRILSDCNLSLHRKLPSEFELSPSGKQTLSKADDNDILARFREIVSDPVNLLICRHPLAGAVTNGLVTLHNGLQVPVSGEHAYYGRFSDILIINRGVHEPLEEYAFQQIANGLPEKPVMLELGAYWGHYSMWLRSMRPRGRSILVEPDSDNLAAGRANFARNGFDATFINDFVGVGHFSVDSFMDASDLEAIAVLHADIQGFELEMLRGAERTLKAGKMDYLFISTHSQDLHDKCLGQLANCGYRTILESGYARHTTSLDGLIVSSRDGLPNPFSDFRPLARTEIPGALPARLLESIAGQVPLQVR